MLLYGPPGTGKTLLAQTLPTILPPLTREEMLEVMQIYSAAGMLKNPLQINRRPFRQIHQTCTLPALIGGGNHAQPGEISLAHHGILFFDEIAEAPRRLIDSLRQPLEERRITISRFHHHVNYPANFTLVAAMNPCPCGYYGSAEKPCSCSNGAIVQYHKKLSGPMLDRFDLFIKLEREPVKLQTPSNQKSSEEFRATIIKARELQKIRLKKDDPKIDLQTESFIIDRANKYKVSMRSYHHILKVARTIADLNGNEQILKTDALEAFLYRLQPASPLV